MFARKRLQAPTCRRSGPDLPAACARMRHAAAAWGSLIRQPPPPQCYGRTWQGKESLGLHTGLLGPWGVRGEQQICTKTLTCVCSVICSPLEQHSERDSTDKAVPLAPETHGAAGTWQHVANILSATSMANVLGDKIPVVNANLQVSTHALYSKQRHRVLASA